MKTYRFIALLIMMMASLRISARSVQWGYELDGGNDHYVPQEWFDWDWDRYEGTLTVKVRYYTSFGANIGDGHCGFTKNNERTNYVEIDGRQYEFNVNANGNDFAFANALSDGESYSTQDNYDAGDVYKTFYLTVPMKPSWVNSSVHIKLYGRWWRRGLASDNNVDYSYTADLNVDMGTLSPDGDAIFTFTGSQPGFALPYYKNSGFSSGEIGLFNQANNNEVGANREDAFGMQTIDYFPGSASKLDQSQEFYFKQIYKTNNVFDLTYEQRSESFVFPAYPQAKDLTAEVNQNTRKVTVKWSLRNAPNDNVIKDYFVLSYDGYSYHKNGTNTEVTTLHDTVHIAYTGNKVSYQYEFVAPEGENIAYNFSLYRSSTENESPWSNYTLNCRNVVVNTEHMYPATPSVKLSENQRTAIVQWAVTGTIYSQGTRFTIIRRSLLNNQESTISLSESAFRTGQYEDKSVTFCEKYQYALRLEPGGDYVQTADMIIPEEITPVEIGAISDLNVSKGYFNNRVQLQWQIEGNFDNYIIERSRADQNKFIRVQSLSGTGALASMLYNDETALPGVMYNYRVYGLVSCGGELHSSNDTLYSVGFRCPTANIYGRITFENGQGVDSVEVLAETATDLSTHSLYFSGEDSIFATLPSALLQQAHTATISAWVRPENTTGEQIIIRKGESYKIGIVNGRLFAEANGFRLESDSVLSNHQWAHLAMVKDTSTVSLYCNGHEVVRDSANLGVCIDNEQWLIGQGWAGNLTDLRFYNRDLEAHEISTDYSRFLTGAESGLAAYYTFAQMTDNAFFDISYEGDTYHQNDGTHNAVISNEMPSKAQLWYRAYTQLDGSYAMQGVPYIGNGTAYTITPVKGTHQFAPTSEIRFLSETSNNHTINFTDNSSFRVTGTVMYAGGTFPVEGVQFKIDGVTAVQKNGTPYQTDAEGKFNIQVPVGQHDVRASLSGHTFVGEGRITNSDGTDRNYQDILSGIELYDSTFVTYIGRVAGGTVQEKYPVGFSLSKNNLADDICLTLEVPTTKNFKLRLEPDTIVVAHHITQGARAREESLGHEVKAPASTTVIIGEKTIKIYPDTATGEFVAPVMPDLYNVTVSMTGHTDIPGSGSQLNFKNAANTHKKEGYHYWDSLLVNNQWKFIEYNDSIDYNYKQLFIKRYEPEIDVVQIGKENNHTYGADSVVLNLASGKTFTVPFIDNLQANHYTFGKPVFLTGNEYNLSITIFEGYRRYNTLGEQIAEERVPTTDAVLHISNGLAGENKDLNVDSIGRIVYTFIVGEPDMQTATNTLTMTAKYGNAEHPTTVAWNNPLGNVSGSAYMLGSHMTGTDFITAGPDKVLCVLRDPPGSNSYSYIEKGSTFTDKTAYNWEVTNENSVSGGAGVKNTTSTIIATGGVGSFVGTEQLVTETENEGSTTVTNSNKVDGSNGVTRTISIDNRISTNSSDAKSDFVGANADLFVGYSTNVTFGYNKLVTILPRVHFDSIGGADAVNMIYDDTHPDYVIVQQEGMSAGVSFKTMFAYSQKFIEQTQIPKLRRVRNNLLTRVITDSVEVMNLFAQFQELGNDSILYVSYVPPTDPNFATSDKYYGIMRDTAYCIAHHITVIDTIHALNQSIAHWERQLAANDSVKLTVGEKDLLQNYSFNSGTGLSYSESYSTCRASDVNFSIGIVTSTGFNSKSTVAVASTTTGFSVNVGTEHGGSYGKEFERKHTIGYEMSTNAGGYLSVDVYHEPGWNREKEEYDVPNYGATGAAQETHVKDLTSFRTFVFKTKGGATACPYEDGYTAKHWKGHENEVIDAPTLYAEKPTIHVVGSNFINNVPSGEAANITVAISNQAESGTGRSFVMELDESCNPYGAQIFCDGSSITGKSLSFWLDPGQVAYKTIRVQRGSALNYDDLQLRFGSECESALYDTCSFSVHFTPSCTEVNIVRPTDNWVYNTTLPTRIVNGVEKHYMEVLIGGFNVNYDSFHHLALQYKPSSSPSDKWTTLMNYYSNDSLYNVALNNGLAATKIADVLNVSGQIPYELFMDEMSDRQYDLRAVSYCDINNNEILYEGPVHTGVKDMYKPRTFGNPEPTNGILNYGENATIQFNEKIAGGDLTEHNFIVTAVRNGAIDDHNGVALSFDGVSSYAQAEYTTYTQRSDNTIELDYRINELQDATLAAFGTIDQCIELKMSANGQWIVVINNQEYRSNNAVQKLGEWQHVAVLLAKDGNLTLYHNMQAVINTATDGYEGNGSIYLGCNCQHNELFKGEISSLRIWTKLCTVSELQNNQNIVLSGKESNIVVLYPMTEGRGVITTDKAKGVHLLLHNVKWMLPSGFSAYFDGTSHLTINTAEAVITDGDFTVDLWFKAQDVANGSILDNTQYTADFDTIQNIKLYFDESQQLMLLHDGKQTRLVGNYADGQWHAFTYTLSRLSGLAYIYMDGELNSYYSAELVGGIAAPNMRVGEHFIGNVDEIRIWNTFRPNNMIAERAFSKVDTACVGLKLYYPFEHYITWQGTQECVFYGASDNFKSNDQAPIRNEEPLSKLNYQFTYNDDAIRFTLTEEPVRIENATVTFSVQDVYDQHGNPMLSPVTWQAYIKQNNLVWINNTINEQKLIGEELTLSTYAYNNNGKTANYTLLNMPDWLSLTANENQDGTINPLAIQQFDFVVNKQLAVGEYDETIYLHNEDNNISEPLYIHLSVTGNEPQWKPLERPAYTMSIIGKLQFDGKFSTNEKDYIGVFDAAGNCYGVANCQYNRDMDMYYVMLTVSANEPTNDKPLLFKMYNASNGGIYIAQPDRELTFASNKLYGSLTQPVLFMGLLQQETTYHLYNGWNWISLNLLPEDNTPAGVLGNNWMQGDQIKSYNSFSNFSAANTWEGSLNNLVMTSMYQLYVNENTRDFTLTGQVPNPADYNITLHRNRWNYIGYIEQQSMTLKEALAGYNANEGDIIKSQSEFATYYHNNWIGSLTMMEPGKGYMLYTANQQNEVEQFHFPIAYTHYNAPKYIQSGIASFRNTPDYHAYAANMTLIATSAEMNEGDEIRVYSNGHLVGQATAQSGSSDSVRAFLTIAGEQPTALTFILQSSDSDASVATDEIIFSANEHKGTVDNPVVLHFVRQTMSNDNIDLSTAESIDLYSVSGQLLYKQFSVSQINNLPSGCYLIRMKTANDYQTLKIIKL